MATTQEQATGTVRLHRVFKAPAERVYKAVLDPAANCKWLPPNGFTCTVHQIDPKVGGGYEVSFSELTVRGDVPGISAEEFQEAVTQAAEGCPLSQAIKGNVVVTVEGELA